MSDTPPIPPMTRRVEISCGDKTLVIIADDSGVKVRELGKKPEFKSSWKDIAEFVMQQQFFTFTK